MKLNDGQISVLGDMLLEVGLHERQVARMLATLDPGTVVIPDYKLWGYHQACIDSYPQWDDFDFMAARTSCTGAERAFIEAARAELNRILQGLPF